MHIRESLTLISSILRRLRSRVFESLGFTEGHGANIVSPLDLVQLFDVVVVGADGRTVLADFVYDVLTRYDQLVLFI